MSDVFGGKNPDRHRGFPAAAWEEAQRLGGRLAQLGQERIERYAALWYEVSEQALLRGHYDMVEQAVRHIAEEMRSSGASLADFLEMLRLLRATAVKLKWNEDQLEEMDSVIDVLLPHLGPVPDDWSVPVGFSYRVGAVKETALEAPREPAAAPAPETRAEKRQRTRTKLELMARLSSSEPGWGEAEMTRTANISRTGIYIYSTRNYTPGMRLLVSCPYSDAPGALNRDYLSQVVRIDVTPGQSRKGVAIKFLQTI